MTIENALVRSQFCEEAPRVTVTGAGALRAAANLIHVEVRMPDLPPLIAFDADDLAVIAVNLQDALVRVGGMAYLPRSKQFAMVASRFDWIKAAADKTECPSCERCQTGLHFGRVLKVSCRGFCCRDRELILNLLDIGFKQTEPPAGIVEFIFSAGRALRLEVECIEAEIRDLGLRWKARSAPRHPIDESWLMAWPPSPRLVR